ncbi:MAG: lipopolysaccharide assembly protein LapA domain-containing protein [Xanthomonadales bacterium]|nr:lipopolysaccharide assembly protein LapA domain-containing protein [Xanthomonadales bacterium]
MRRWLSLIVIVLAITVGSFLGILNPEPAAVDLLFIQVQQSLGLVLSVTLVLGLLLGALALWLFRVVPLRARIRRLQKEAKLNRAIQASDTSASGDAQKASETAASGAQTIEHKAA